jgi:hypothetical protein
LTEIDASAFELLPVGVALVAPDHRIVSANKSLLHMLEGRVAASCWGCASTTWSPTPRWAARSTS